MFAPVMPSPTTALSGDEDLALQGGGVISQMGRMSRSSWLNDDAIRTAGTALS